MTKIQENALLVYCCHRQFEHASLEFIGQTYCRPVVEVAAVIRGLVIKTCIRVECYPEAFVQLPSKVQVSVKPDTAFLAEAEKFCLRSAYLHVGLAVFEKIKS